MTCLKSKGSNQFCSVFEQKFLSENRTKLFGFQTFYLFEVNWNRTMDACLKSESVRISDVYCKSVPDLQKNAIAHTTYQVGIKETVDKSNHLSKRVRSPENWYYDNRDIRYSTTQHYIQFCNLQKQHQPTSLTYSGTLALAVR